MLSGQWEADRPPGQVLAGPSWQTGEVHILERRRKVLTCLLSPVFVAEGQEDAILSYEPVTRQESKPCSESLAFQLVVQSWGPTCGGCGGGGRQGRAPAA